MLAAMSKRITSFARLAFALFAVSLLLLQATCEAAELSASAGESCCLIGAPAPLQAATAAAEEPCLAIPCATVGLPALRPETVVAGAVASAAPLPVPRYHARSARIQR